MNERWTANKVLLILCAVVFLAYICPAEDAGYTTEMGGVKIVLPAGWKHLDFDGATNFWVQTRAHNVEQGIALSAGSATIDLNLEQCAALCLIGLGSGRDATLSKLVKGLGVSKEEVEKALSSQMGRQLKDSVKDWSGILRSELLKVSRKDFEGQTRIKLHWKFVLVMSGDISFSRQFLLGGSSPHNYVQISYWSTSDEIFTQMDLIDTIRPETKVK